LEIKVDEPVVEGDRVASRWTARGTNRGRQVALRGITISRFEEGKIIEDWGYSDTVDLLRQLGPLRVIALGVVQLIKTLRP
ncbi:MAG: ester cyclase, partial [Thermoleophilaceae bacterium]